MDRSGKNFGRPAFGELLSRLRGGEASAVVVYRMSRFGRDFYETIRTVRQLRDEGIQFHSASERLDLDSPNGRLMFNVLASFDEYELDIRREYWAETKARVMKERGVHLGRTPIGYLGASKQPKHACDITLARGSELLCELGSKGAGLRRPRPRSGGGAGNPTGVRAAGRRRAVRRARRDARPRGASPEWPPLDVDAGWPDAEPPRVLQLCARRSPARPAEQFVPASGQNTARACETCARSVPTRRRAPAAELARSPLATTSQSASRSLRRHEPKPPDPRQHLAVPPRLLCLPSAPTQPTRLDLLEREH